ncbi:AbrB family transcriptional regulator [Acidaminobacter hydrogenoformans]|uniref:SpoVT-AbrB domain-containing protein n=1 Tax=Acidaminobacter hydrogenoformans DSM 2784 TaxID=1120920 RepID=A0A1G5RQW5_9FIRM|nr:AbrB family transcriptional regulator [Acidaminobacter hydrogenoformans]SCZ76386.1 hypothetical protein SAMN03080599_00210 [Acidaminobacter hydrogenoformans DSM 2784]
MSEKQSEYAPYNFEKRRIHVSSKRQITIPAKYYQALGSVNEMECIYSNDMLILKPVQYDDPGLSEEILADLIAQGYSGETLLAEFKRINRQIRPAIETLIKEADELAKKVSEDHVDLTDELFGITESEE